MPVEPTIQLLREKLPPALFLHCSSVAKTAVELASDLGADKSQAQLAGLLHDCARHLSPGELFFLAEANDIEVDWFHRRYPVLLHAPIGAFIARSWGFNDETVLDAIRCHTLGLPGMSLLGRILYAADKIEPGRNYPGVEQLRVKICNDFHSGLLDVVAHSISYIMSGKQAVHPSTVSFWNWLLDITL
ncbi:MAG: bis(5'-nucleosyl)-tetraphosphatase (symmetrical) YqeK [Dethiobacter sp.]|nr:bis(5'-nucleosyl)-tetraphosphatase (symmetrical) YqeK [Dethiobacter sp.]